MKKANTARHKARRQGALDRFSIDPDRAHKDPEYAKRKLTEPAALKASLGVV